MESGLSELCQKWHAGNQMGTNDHDHSYFPKRDVQKSPEGGLDEVVERKIW